ncbi:MAG: hypothetical protein K9H26_10445 [Prolixibacteraceae bacterium]|nr:hypothetical protein [Prolixibacteraceae bacterium]
MKNLSILFLFLIILTGCKEVPEETKPPTLDDYLGTWANTVTLKDTLKWYEEEIERYDTITEQFIFAYTYSLFKDSIRIKKIRGYYIEVIEKDFKIGLNEDKTVLTIEDFDQYYPRYSGYVYNRVNP